MDLYELPKDTNSLEILRASGGEVMARQVHTLAHMGRLITRTVAMVLIACGAAACGGSSADEAVDDSVHDLLGNAPLQKEYENATLDDFELIKIHDLADLDGGFLDVLSDAREDAFETLRRQKVKNPETGRYEDVRVWLAAQAKTWKTSSGEIHYVLHAFRRDGKTAVTQIYSSTGRTRGQRILTAIEDDKKIEWLAPASLFNYVESPKLTPSDSSAQADAP